MIDATPSFEAAVGLKGRDLAGYLSRRGWSEGPSRIEGISIFAKAVPGAEQSVKLILPVRAGFDDEARRVADALRTLAQIEGRTEVEIATELRGSLSKEEASDVGSVAPVSNDPDLTEDENIRLLEHFLSDFEVENAALSLRRDLGLSDQSVFNIVEVLQTALPKVLKDFVIEIYQQGERVDFEAYSQASPPKIFVRRDVFEGALRDDPRSRTCAGSRDGSLVVAHRSIRASNEAIW